MTLLLLLLLVLATDISVSPLCFSFKFIAVNVVTMVGGGVSVLIVTLSFLSMVIEANFKYSNFYSEL